MSSDRTARVLVVDDSAFVRRFLTRIIEAEPRLELVGTAVNGRLGVEKAIELKPDLITLDIEMPEMDGLTALENIRDKCPRPRPRVLMCSTLTERGSKESLRALSLGASDVIFKDLDAFGSDPDAPRREILSKLLGIANLVTRGAARASGTAGAAGTATPGAGAPRASTRRSAPRPFEPGFRPRLLLIGSSTGGPPALEKLLTRLPKNYPCPVVIAQHMPPLFTKSIAERLDGMCQIGVEHAEGRVNLRPGTGYIIKGGQHGSIKGAPDALMLSVADTPAGHLYMPSVDVLFDTAAKTVRSQAVGVVLTGMGDDGARGSAMLKNAGGVVYTQTEDSCVIYGMPRMVDEAGLSMGSLTPEAMGDHLATLGGARANAA